MARTLTAANSILMLSITGLFPVPQRIQGYATDDAFSTEAVTPAEVMKGVDGKMSYGYVPYMTPMTISLQADSQSNDMFDAWLSAQKAAGEVFPANGLITLPGLGRSYVLVNGVITQIQAFASVRKTLQARAFTITWDSVDPAPLA